MAIAAAVLAKRDELVRLVQTLGENLSREAFGDRGPDLKVTATDLEQFLSPLVEGLAAGFLSGSVQQQSQRLAESLPCPTCGRECLREERERTLVGEHGPFTWREPVCHCEQCERAFFPSANHSED